MTVRSLLTVLALALAPIAVYAVTVYVAAIQEGIRQSFANYDGGDWWAYYLVGQTHERGFALSAMFGAMASGILATAVVCIAGSKRSPIAIASLVPGIAVVLATHFGLGSMYHNWPPVQTAVELGAVDSLDRWAKERPDALLSPKYYGMSVAFIAAMERQQEVLTWLLRRKEIVAAISEQEGSLLLAIATHEGWIEVLELGLAADMNPLGHFPSMLSTGSPALEPGTLATVAHSSALEVAIETCCCECLQLIFQAVEVDTNSLETAPQQCECFEEFKRTGGQ